MRTYTPARVRAYTCLALIYLCIPKAYPPPPRNAPHHNRLRKKPRKITQNCTKKTNASEFHRKRSFAKPILKTDSAEFFHNFIAAAFLAQKQNILFRKNIRYDFSRFGKFFFHFRNKFQLRTAAHKVMPLVLRGKVSIARKIIRKKPHAALNRH